MKRRAFTLIEMLIAMAIVLILFGALIVATKQLKAQSQRRLTASAITVIEAALEQYFDNVSPKQFPPMVISDVNFNTELGQSVNIFPVSVAGVDDITASPPRLYWNSGAVYYFLNRMPQSKAILERLPDQMASNRDLNGTAILIEIPTGAAATDWVRFVDAWGTSLNYRYQTGYAFPVIKSAGPDRIFDTEDDVVSQ